MASIYENKMIELEAIGLKFDRSNKEKNDKISVKYNACNKHFFENFTPVTGVNMKLEEFILIKAGHFLFQGYIDASVEEEFEDKNKLKINF